MSYMQRGEFRVLGQMSSNTNNPLEHSLPPVREEGEVRWGWECWKNPKE